MSDRRLVDTPPQIGRTYGVSRRHLCGRKKNAKFVRRNEEICNEYLAGNTLEAIGQRFGITRERVRQVLVKNNIIERHRGAITPRRLKAAEKRENLKILREQRKADIAEKHSKIIALYQDGLKYDDICNALGRDPKVSRSYITSIIRQSGIVPRRPAAWKPRLSDSERQEICQRYAAGENIMKIANSFSIYPRYVYILSNKFGFYRNKRK